MKHDELLLKLWEKRNALCDNLDIHFVLSAVVELHKPRTQADGFVICESCSNSEFFAYKDCKTIQAIEKGLA